MNRNVSIHYLTFLILFIGIHYSTGPLLDVRSPQYPLYTVMLAVHSSLGILYHLNKDAEWVMSALAIEAAIKNAIRDDIMLKVLVIINPGNLTGALLDEAMMQSVLCLCE